MIRTFSGQGTQMLATDQFTAQYEELLDGVYDCVDRIVLNGYFRMGCSPSGFRAWWRRLFGNDDNLSNASLQRFSGRFSRRVRAYAAKHRIPVVYSNREDVRRKHLIADGHLPEDPGFVGLFLVIVGTAPGLVWDVQRTEGGRIRTIERRKRRTWVNHYSFHIMDPEWGHVTFKICGQPPFAAQIMLNGHEYVARQARKAGVSFRKQSNCFTSASSGAELAMIAETLRSPNAVGQLTRLCDRWIYSSCLFFALPPQERKKSGFHYEYSVYQLEYSRNLLFHRGTELERVAQAVIDRTRSLLDVRTVTTLFGYKRRPKYRRNDTRGNRFEAKLERPEYDLTVFKLHFGKLTLKVYTKGERVLRIEAIVHNVEVLRCRRSLPSFPDITALLAQILERFLETLACVDVSSVREDTWEHLREPSCVGTTRVPGVDISKPRMHLFIESVIALAAKPGGFSIKELAAKVREIGGSTHPAYSTSQAAYDLRKLRGKSFLLKVPKSHRYTCSPSGLQAMAAILIINDKVIRPVLAGAGTPHQGHPRTACSPVDLHYRKLQREMRSLFNTLGIAA